jgi:hypothetical protein
VFGEMKSATRPELHVRGGFYSLTFPISCVLANGELPALSLAVWVCGFVTVSFCRRLTLRAAPQLLTVARRWAIPGGHNTSHDRYLGVAEAA